MSALLRNYLAPILSGEEGKLFLQAAEKWDGVRPPEVPSLQELWREWYPLRGALLPVGAGRPEEPWVIPCAALAAPPDSPVFLWDFLADLAAQLDQPIAASFREWHQLTDTRRNALMAEKLPLLRQRQEEVDTENQAALLLFQHIAKDFAAKGGGYDHDEGGMLPRPKSWRPIRVACKDILLAVCAVRFNRDRLSLDICAWVAADHTMFAKGSGTRNALELVLADAVKCGAAAGIRFLENDRPSTRTIPPPRDVAVLARILGASLPGDGIVAGPALNRLERFLASASAPFPAVEIQRSWVDLPARGSGIPEGELLHLVRKGIWSPEEVTALVAHCPSGAQALRGRLEPQQDGMTFDVAWAHLRAARLAELAARELIGSGGSIAQGTPDEPQPAEFTQRDLPGSPYGRVLRYRGKGTTLPIALLKGDGTFDASPLTLRSGDELRLVPVALSPQVLPSYISWEKRQGNPAAIGDEIVVLPADVQTVPLADRCELSRFLAPWRLMVCKSDLLSVDDDILRSVRDARRLGSAATVAGRPPAGSPDDLSPIGVFVRELKPKDHEDGQVVEQIALLLDRLERGLDLDRSRQAAVRLLALRAAQASGGRLCILPPGDASGPRSLDPAQPRRIVLGIRSWRRRDSLGTGGAS